MPWNKGERKDFWLDVVVGGGCWTRGTPSSLGYGHRVYHPVSRQRIQAHRFAYEDFFGVVLPDAVVVHHVCENRACVRPSHLMPVTQHDHPGTTGYVNRQKTHCPQGHAYDDANTYLSASGKRHCKACQRAKDRRRRAACKERING